MIEPTLIKMNEVIGGAMNPAAVNLLIGTAAHESTVGGHTRLHQIGGPARGIYQIEPDTRADIDENYLAFRETLRDFVLGTIPSDSDPDAQLATNLEYATVIARLVYWRRTFTWPDDPADLDALGDIWKQHYNTALGAGTAEQFIEHFPQEVLS